MNLLARGTVIPFKWDWLWGLKVPPKIRTFLWRACHDIIPVRATLVRRHVVSNPYCDFCRIGVETGSHIFFECPFFGKIWSDPPFSLSSSVVAPNLAARLGWLRDKLDSAAFSLAVVVLWNIWNFRNGFQHGEDVGSTENIITCSQAFLDSYSSAQIFFPVAAVGPRTVSWQPPPAETIKVNLDAAILDSEWFQIAAVDRDYLGRWVGWSVRRIRGAPAPVVAEAYAAMVFS